VQATPGPELTVTPLPGASGWSVLSPVMVRTTGSPANLLEQLTWAAPADDEQLFYQELHRTSKVLMQIASLGLFREALAWQNPNVYSILDSYVRTAQEPKRNSKKRQREYALARYLARYCGKTETIGFFGPSSWGTLTGASGHIDQWPGRALVSDRHTVAEAWAVRKLAAVLAADPEIAQWLPVRSRSHYAVRNGTLFRPHAVPSPLSDLELAVLRCCDGERPRSRVTEQVAAALDLDQDVVDACVNDLIRRRCLVAGANLPLDPRSAAVLSARIAAIGDETTRQRAAAIVAPFFAALRELALAGGDAESVTAAQATLGRVFHEIVGTDATRRPGRMYAGRGLAYEDCLRDLRMDLGADFLARVSEGMHGILTMAQWLTWQTATVYEAHFRRKWSGRNQPLDAVWFDILRDFFGSGPKPADNVLAEFRLRWGQLVAELHASASGWTFDPDEFHDAAERLFPSPGPGWPEAATHSPDLQLVSHSPDGVRTGDYDVVLGEIHVGTPTIEGPIFEWSLGDDYPISRYLRSRIGRSVLPVIPDSWPRNTGRTLVTHPMPGDLCFAFVDVDGTPPDTIAMTDIEVGVADGAVFAELPDGTRLAFTDFFSFFLSAVVTDAWKAISAAAYTPRISVGRFIVVRESWRVDVTGQPFTRKAGEYESYRAMDQWRRSLGCPDRVYIKISGEVKPFYVDFSSPISVLSFLAVLRGLPEEAEWSGQVHLSEALPEPAHAWAVDSARSTYVGEVRMVVLADRIARPSQPD
jgi:Lantibiotic dehydratase, N terminus